MDNNDIVEAFIGGFHEIVNPDHVVKGVKFRDLTSEQLINLFVGSFSVNDWRNSTKLRYKGNIIDSGYANNPADVQNAVAICNLFWKIINEFDEKTQKRSSTIPIRASVCYTRSNIHDFRSESSQGKVTRCTHLQFTA